MRRETLLDFFNDFAELDRTFLVHDDGYRVREFTYAETARLARACAARFRQAGLRAGDAVIVWSENRPEWIVALWGALLEGVVAVPLDYRVSSDFLWRVVDKTSARVLLLGDDVRLESLQTGVAAWNIRDLADRKDTENDAERRASFSPTASTTAEIIFTSGATAEPKGVVITHRNILANIVPIEREMTKYRRIIRVFSPLRFLNLLPLSHMFGQAMATFVPPMLPGEVIFSHSFNPHEIVRQIKSRRISVLVCVPKVLEVLRDHVVRTFPDAAVPDPAKVHFAWRWWIYRHVHRMFGFKFWAFVVGAAPLDPGLEEYWSRLGFAVVQGYGLTETAPIVTLNHPLRPRRGSVGSPIAGVEIRIAPDGEILVRGDNVTTGYYNAPGETRAAFEDGWLHTGDIGSVDETGRLTIKGRKKEMIVTPEGLNVFPEDVERALNAQPGVRDSAVIGTTPAGSGQERVHAVLLLEPGANTDSIVRAANARLEDHQRVRSFSVWPGDALPRTEGTGKLRRKEIQRRVTGAGTPDAAKLGGHERSVSAVVSRFARTRAVSSETTIEELGLSSLERIELMMALEDALDSSLDESEFAGAKTVGELERLTERGAEGAERPRRAETRRSDAPPRSAEREIAFPRWNRSWPARALRRVSLPTWILPLARVFAWTTVDGLDHLRNLSGPVIFAANHQSHMDTPVIMWVLPARWRYRVAPAMAKEFFKAHFFPEQFTRREYATNSLNYYLSALFFNAFPLPQREAGARQALRYAGELLSDGYSILIFPEGRRTKEGEIATFQAGVGMMASRLGVPVVPVRIDGLDRVLHPTWKMARPGRVQVRFGAPLTLAGDDFGALARQVEEAVRGL